MIDAERISKAMLQAHASVGVRNTEDTRTAEHDRENVRAELHIKRHQIQVVPW